MAFLNRKERPFMFYTKNCPECHSKWTLNNTHNNTHIAYLKIGTIKFTFIYICLVNVALDFWCLGWNISVNKNNVYAMHIYHVHSPIVIY